MPLTEARPDALAETYARSLFELADARGAERGGSQATIEAVSGELEGILELARGGGSGGGGGEFSEFLASRVLPVADRARSLEAIFRGRLSDLTLNFLLVLNQKGRLSHLPPIAAAYDALVQARFGRVEVDVYTASPIGPGELRAIKDRLSATLGREAIVHPYTDNAMIGGIRLRVGDQLIDASIATRLRKFRDQLASEGSARLRARAERIMDDADGPLE